MQRVIEINRKRKRKKLRDMEFECEIPIKYRLVCVVNCTADRIWTSKMVQCASKLGCVSEACEGLFHPTCWKNEQGNNGFCIHCVRKNDVGL